MLLTSKRSIDHLRPALRSDSLSSRIHDLPRINHLPKSIILRTCLSKDRLSPPRPHVRPGSTEGQRSLSEFQSPVPSSPQRSNQLQHVNERLAGLRNGSRITYRCKPFFHQPGTGHRPRKYLTCVTGLAVRVLRLSVTAPIICAAGQKVLRVGSITATPK